MRKKLFLRCDNGIVGTLHKELRVGGSHELHRKHDPVYFLVQLAAYTLRVAHWVPESPDLRTAAGHAAGQHPDHRAVCCRIWSSTAGSPGKAGTISAGGPSFPCCWPWWPGWSPGPGCCASPCPGSSKRFWAALWYFWDWKWPPAGCAPSARTVRRSPWLRYLVAFFSGMCAGLFGINMFLVALPSDYCCVTMNSRAAFASSFWVKTCSAPGCISAPGS